MKQRSGSRVPPPWTRAGNRWGPRVYWPMFCLSIVLLVWKLIDGAGAGRIIGAVCLVLVWPCLLVANRRNARRRQSL
ncbi:hypothetical protein [Streptomyces sp. NPDC005907]|uniref:hypothetical protein n=1 Tax=Streptomyces sp. NPDC005907 TaxID=3154571 RepID=UPI0033F22047